MKPLALASCALLLISSTTLAEDWSGFRGTRGNGISAEKEAPLEWSAEENVLWKAALPRPANGSPIVVKGRVLVTSAEDDKGHGRSLYCFDRRDGEQLWVQTVHFDRDMPTHETNPYCGSTPAASDDRVVVWHGSAGLFCYDLDGKQLWQRDLGEYRHMWGYGTSPVIHDDRVILHTGPGEQIYMMALSLEDGATIWKQEEPRTGTGAYNADKKYLGSWSTPVLAAIDGRVQAICSMPTRVVSYDVGTGEVLWYCEGISGERGDLAYSSVMLGKDVCVAHGGFRGPAMAFPLSGRGDLTEARLWRRVGENPQNIGTGILIGDYYYMANAGPGTLECLEVRTGKQRWEERAEGGNLWGSMVQVGDHIYITSQKGVTTVFKPSPEGLQVVATNSLGEASNSTPAVSDGNIFLRTTSHLWCIGASEDADGI